MCIRDSAYTVKEKAYDCAINLLAQKKKERENSVEIVKTDMGYNVNCKISGGNLDLLSFSIFAPDMPQAQIILSLIHISILKVWSSLFKGSWVWAAPKKAVFITNYQAQTATLFVC